MLRLGKGGYWEGGGEGWRNRGWGGGRGVRRFSLLGGG